MLQQVFIVEAWTCEEVSIFYCLQEISWGGSEVTSMKILDQFCFRFVSCDDCMSAMSQWS